MHEINPLPFFMPALQIFGILEKHFDDMFPPLSDFIQLAEDHLKCLLPGSKHSKIYYIYLIKYFKTFSIPREKLCNYNIQVNEDEKEDEEDEEEVYLSFEQRKLNRIKLGIAPDYDSDDDGNDQDESWVAGVEEETMTGPGSKAGNYYESNSTNDEDGGNDWMVEGEITL